MSVAQIRVLLLYSLLLPVITLAQQPVFRHYTANDGLPSSEIYKVIQDKAGFMWFATDRGIARFDGYSFHTISTADGLSDNTVFALHEDDKGRIWYHPYSSRVGYLYNGIPHVYPHNAIIRDFLKGGVIDGIVIGENDDFLICSENPHAFEIKMMHIASDGKADTAYHTKYLDIYISKTGKQCVCSGSMRSDTIRVLSAQTKKLLFTLPGGTKEMVGSVYLNKRNDILGINTASRIFIYKNDSCIKTIKVKDRVLCLDFDNNENLLVGYLHKGFEIYSASSNYDIHTRFLENYSITGIACDRDGGLWFCTLESGVYYLPYGFSYTFNVDNGLPQSRAKQIRNISGDAVVIFVDKSFVKVYKNAHNEYAIRGSKDALSDISYDPLTGKVYVIAFSPFKIPFKNVVFLEGISTMAVGKDAVWYFSASHLQKADKNGHKLLDTMLFADRIERLFQKDEGDLLIGTIEGLYEYSSKGSLIALKNYHPLLNSRISDIKRLDNEYIAIATIGQGILLVHNNDFAHPEQLTVKDGLPSTMCNVLLPDSTTIWVGTNKGLCRIDNVLDKAKRTFYVFDSRNAIISNEINDLCKIDNNLWIATMNGISILSRSISPLKTDIPLYIEQVLVNGNAINKESNAPFTYRQNNINIFFTGLNYEDAGKLLYRYRLKGLDDKWNTTANRNVVYNKLVPGSYVFELNLIGPNQQRSSVTRQYSFTIQKPYWSTWWFISLCGALAVSSIYMLVYFRIKVVKKNAAIKSDLNKFREQALRSQMNPHFLYNSMNSIQNFIRKNDQDQSIDLLVKFSSLMRLTFNNSGAQLVTIAEDLRALNLYVEIESQRFPGKFKFHSEIDSAIHIGTTHIPPFLIQPFVENAILHGFTVKDTPGDIWLAISLQQKSIKITIRDNGIGREKALEIKRRKERYLLSPDRKDSAVSVTETRITQVWGRNAPAGVFKIVDLYEAGVPAGTLVEFYLPLNYDKSYTG